MTSVSDRGSERESMCVHALCLCNNNHRWVTIFVLFQKIMKILYGRRLFVQAKILYVSGVFVCVHLITWFFMLTNKNKNNEGNKVIFSAHTFLIFIDESYTLSQIYHTVSL